MFDVALSVRSENRLDFFAQSVGQSGINVNQILSAAVCDVESLARALVRCLARLEVSLDNILNISEITALPAVAVDCRRLVIH